MWGGRTTPNPRLSKKDCWPALEATACPHGLATTKSVWWILQESLDLADVVRDGRRRKVWSPGFILVGAEEGTPRQHRAHHRA